MDRKTIPLCNQGTIKKMVQEYNEHNAYCENKIKEINTWGTKKAPKLTFLKKKV